MNYLKLTKILVKYPVNFVRNLNKENIDKYRHAIKNENWKQILRNIERYLSNGYEEVSPAPEGHLPVRISEFIAKIKKLNTSPKREVMLFISHETTLTGAPLIIHQVARDFYAHHEIYPIFILLKGGKIRDLFSKKFPSYQLPDQFSEVEKAEEVQQLLTALTSEIEINCTYLNSAESRFILPVLKMAKIPNVISLVHEMGNLYPKNSWQVISRHSDHVVFPCEFVHNKALENATFNQQVVSIKGQGLLKPEIFEADQAKHRKYLRKHLGILEDAKIVLSCGTPIARKGIDIFVFTAISALSKWTETSPLYFIWIGDAPDNHYQRWTRRDIEFSDFSKNILFLDSKDDIIPWFVGSDIFFLTSRGDPFPCVVHEALAAGLQVVGFDNTGGLAEMLPPQAALLNPYGDLASASSTILSNLKQPDPEVRQSIIDYARKTLNFKDYSQYLLDITRDQVHESSLKSKTTLIETLVPLENIQSVLEDLAPWQMRIALGNGTVSTDGNTGSLPSQDKLPHTIIDLESEASFFNDLYPEGLTGKSFLDVGCNAGGYTFLAKRLGAEFCYGIDQKEHSIKQAIYLRNFFKFDAYDVDFQVQDIDTFLLKDRVFDIAFLKGVFETSPFPVKTLSELSKNVSEAIFVDTIIQHGLTDGCLRLTHQEPESVPEALSAISWKPSDKEVIEKLLYWCGFKYNNTWINPLNEQESHIRIYASRKKLASNQESLFWKYGKEMHPRSKIELPVPPEVYMHYNETPEAHLKTGKREVDNIKLCLNNSGYNSSEFKKILEFGCNNCRLLRWFYEEGNHRELWGCDIDEKVIDWDRKHLGEVISVKHNNHNPPLDFEDDYFEFIFAGSIFTHIDQNATEWLNELVRITQPGGLLYLTFLDENSMKVLATQPERKVYNKVASQANIKEIWDGQFDKISIPGLNGSTDKSVGLILCHSNYIRTMYGDELELIQVMKKAYAGFQTAYLFRKKTV